MTGDRGFTLQADGNATDLVVTGEWTDEMGLAVLSGQADGLVLNYALGFRGRDLACVRGLPLRRLSVLARTITDVDPIYTLGATLQSLWVQLGSSVQLDLGRLPQLRVLSGEWRQLCGSVSALAHLQQLHTLGYADDDLTPLAGNPALEVLAFRDRPALRSLRGVDDLPALRVLGVFGAHRLDDLAELAGGPTGLTDLELEGCRGISDLGPVGTRTQLRFLNASECGDVASLAPLGRLAELRRLYLYGSTKVLDGDLEPLTGLPHLEELRMQSRRHYRPPLATVLDALSSR